ncbi:MAG: hypothetical protein HUU14_12505 [Dehalococcoidia bacterium]|nr:hypothetical protein [Chloroflexi bacterium CFX7]MCK6564027.1 hypothetical protein [Dehalococcoidia bacterium]MCL4232077.1 hypothetical protein [Dehalococcoidia bacterium]NUQ56702.1 hypothetical protein [Dehalococcoidia bacterium]RIL01693.1 MAG: hypothetical protein DCC78_09665 [bacterium]
MPAREPIRCIRCYVPIAGEPVLMAGRAYCCQSCSDGSVCEHQGISRPAAMRRFDSMFAPFREVARHGSPYAFDRPGPGGASHD